jgi:dGTPase
MKDISMEEVVRRYKATTGALSHLATVTSHRRFSYGDQDLQCLDNPFIRDQRAILCSKARRRQAHKNQVACSDDIQVHLRNRATHVDEVKACAISIADHLDLNIALAGSIAEGHDIGHVPYGHQGEHYIQERTGTPFCHEVMGVVIMQKIERKGKGVNLTHATLDGMHRHSGDRVSNTMTQEAWVVRYADKIAYLFADYNDFTRLQHRCSRGLVALMNWFGDNQRGRTTRTVMALYEESAEAGKVQFEKSEPAQRFKELRNLMYREYVKIVEQDVARKLDPIYDFLQKSEMIPPALGIALLTDVEVCRIIREGRLVSTKHIMATGLGEIIELIPRKKLFSIDMNDLDLDW